jgi:hypothetical protein
LKRPGHVDFVVAISLRVISSLAIASIALLPKADSADAARCRPPESPAMLTGPVYESIQAECEWVDAINRRDRKAAARILHPNVHQVDARGAVRREAALLKTVAEGRFGQVMMNPAQISVPFSAGSTNVVVSTWTFQRRTHRVTDVFFCDVTRTCTYRLIAEQITIVSP